MGALRAPGRARDRLARRGSVLAGHHRGGDRGAGGSVRGQYAALGVDRLGVLAAARVPGGAAAQPYSSARIRGWPTGRWRWPARGAVGGSRGGGSEVEGGIPVKTRALVAGAGGFIGHHMVKSLKQRGYWVRGVDVKPPAYEPTVADEFEILDLRRRADSLQATRAVDECYNFAANMGGIGFITAYKAEIMRDSVLINTHMLEAARTNGI